MTSVMSRLVQGTNPLVSSIVALAGGLAGGGVYLSLPGAVLGLLVALFVCAMLSIVSVTAGIFGEEPAPVSTSAIIADVPAASASQDTAAAAEPTETEAGFISAGRFADYHLAKAKRLFAAGNFKEAAYQASASLGHGSLDEARELRQRAQAALKA